MINKRFILLLALLVLLSACQPTAFSGAQAQLAVPTPIPLPLTGERASPLGASALTIQGKYGADSFFLAPVLADGGKPTPGFSPIELGMNIQYAFSPDREQLAVVSYRTKSCREYCLHLIDLREWKEVFPPVEIAKSFYNWAPAIVFTADSTRIVIGLNDQTHTSSKVVVVDGKTGEIAASAMWDANVYRPEILFNMHSTPAGDLALYGAAGQGSQVEDLRAVLLDGDSLEVLWQQDLSGVSYGSEPTDPGYDPVLGRYLQPGAVFSPDGSKLYLVAADKEELVTVDFARRSVASAAIRPPQSLFDRLMALGAGVVHAKMLNGTTKNAVNSNDGTRLFVVGQTMISTKNDRGEYITEVTPLGLKVIDPASGTELFKLDNKSSYFTLAPDGKTLFLDTWYDPTHPTAHPVTQLFDTTTLKVSGSLPGDVRATRLLNGEFAWLATEPLTERTTRLAIYTPGSAIPRSQWMVEGEYVDWVVVP